MLEAWAASQAEPDAARQTFGAMSLLGYCPNGDVIADAAVFLLSNEARFITGCILPVSGGAEIGYKR
jgi:NAD(P)-dependent dehydrogenase (short-subunit alcohol dehydrogenase family)